MKRIIVRIMLIAFLLNILFSKSFNFVYAYDSYITSGIVQSINTSERTITLYAEDGKTSSDLYRKFNLTNAYSLKVQNNNIAASISDIYPQDKVFIKVVNGYVNEISFSRIINKLDVQTKLSVNNVYNTVLSSYDSLNSQIIINDILSLENGNWGYTPHKGFARILVDSSTRIYCDNELVSLSDISNYLGKEIFVAVGKGIYSEEKVVFIKINSSSNVQSNIYEGQIRNVSTGKLRFKNSSYDFTLGNDTLFVKNGLLVTSDDLSPGDYVYAVVTRASGSRNVLIVYVNESDGVLDNYEAYYAEIKDVDIGEKLEVQTTRIYDLNDGGWRHFSRRKTFKISGNTRILDENGVVNNRNISSFLVGDSRIYANILACEDEAVVISLNYGISHSTRNTLKARVGSITFENSAAKEFNIYNAEEYSNTMNSWRDIENQSLTVANNTIYLRNRKVILASDIKIGDTITAYINWSYSDKTALIIVVN